MSAIWETDSWLDLCHVEFPAAGDPVSRHKVGLYTVEVDPQESPPDCEIYYQPEGYRYSHPPKALVARTSSVGFDGIDSWVATEIRADMKRRWYADRPWLSGDGEPSP